jgi:hypothetical protein
MPYLVRSITPVHKTARVGNFTPLLGKAIEAQIFWLSLPYIHEISSETSCAFTIGDGPAKAKLYLGKGYARVRVADAREIIKGGTDTHSLRRIGSHWLPGSKG